MPGDWETVRLDAGIRIRAGKSPHYASDDAGSVPVHGANGAIGRASASNATLGIAVGRVGASGAVRRITEPVWLSDNVLHLVPDPDAWDEAFVFHLLSSARLPQLATKTAQPLLTQTDLASILLPMPPRAEQRRIAALLDAIDDLIERTEAAIAATESLREALLHELLTRGLPGRHTEWKKVAGVGSVPACWGATTAGDVSAHVTKGATPTTFGHLWAESGPVFLRSECVGEGILLPAAAMHITEAAHEDLRRSRVRDGDILMTITGYIGRVCRVPVGFGEASINQHIARIRVLSDCAMTPEFAYWVLVSPRIRRSLRDQVTGIAYPQIGLAEVRSIALPVPPRDEQVEIVAVLDSAAALVQAEIDALNQLRLLKRASTDALLTGRLRVAIFAPASDAS